MLSFKDQESVCFTSWCFDHRHADKEASSHRFCSFSQCCKPLPIWLKWLPGGFQGLRLFLLLFSPFSPLGRQTLKNQTFKGNHAKATMSKIKWQHIPIESYQLKKRPKKTLDLYFRLIFDTETIFYNNQKTPNKEAMTKPSKSWGIGWIWSSPYC